MKPLLRDPDTGRILDRLEIIDAEGGETLGEIDAQQAFRGLRQPNLTMDTDLYELTMCAGYGLVGKSNQKACFDLYYRKNPDDGAFCIFAGLERVVDYVNNLRIYPDDIEYLRTLGIFSEEALQHVAQGIKFTGDIWAVPEGTLVFPNEPLLRVIGPIAEAQVLETTLLAIVGHQTLIATKAARLSLATKGAPVVDFGTRRAHGPEAALWGARSAYIGGCAGTSNVRAGKMFGIPIRGTHAHSWVESFDEETDSFRGFVESFPDNTILLVDTYDTINGIRLAIDQAHELKRRGGRLMGIRIDSGDLAYYSKAARYMLDEANFPDVKILASGDLDEFLIESLRDQGARIDIWCVGTKLITSYHTPALGVVYKLMAADHGDGKLAPKIKISENPQKVTNPGVKKIVRFSNGKGRMIGDVLTGVDEPLPQDEKVRAHHPMYEYMKRTIKPPYHAEEVLIPVFVNGRQVYEPPRLSDMRSRAAEQIERLEPEYRRLTNPHIYKVSLSDKLYDTKRTLLEYHRDKNHAGEK
ncbi:MAG: nicotinate phosphoribosyltransferase [Thermodesulfobacteriota bacterium]